MSPAASSFRILENLHSKKSEYANKKLVFSLIRKMRSVSQMRKVNEINAAP